jgi:[protein-PII] uridylyltransferase
VVAAAGVAPPAPIARRPPARRAAAFKIEPWVRVDNELSVTATVVEVSARDRPGLLADVARVLAKANLSVTSAHIDGHGERVSDVFYVRRPDGGKLQEAEEIAALQEALLEVLGDGEPETPAAIGGMRLALAPASPLR